MTENDLKSVLAKYQQKAFELFNQNIVLETQIEQLNASVNSLSTELEKLKKSKRAPKEDFE
jgi:dynactin complex subunit